MTVLKWIAISGATVAILAIARRLFGGARLPMPDCKDLPAAHHSGKRDTSLLRLIVLHSTEGDTAAGAAGWFANPASAGSTQIVVDDVDCFRSVPDDVQPWGAVGGDANPHGLHIEMAGHAAWTRAQWLAHRATLEKVAAWLQEWSARYHIPLVFLDAAAVRSGARGVTTHAVISEAYKVPGGHVDPGTGFPIDVLMALARGEG